jgi:Nucleotide modification associated domain 2
VGSSDAQSSASDADMSRLFTYTIPVDDGAAPNPFWGMCSLAICKPGIRRVAKKDDWVAGLGSKNSPSGDLSKHLVYAMRVEEVLTLEEYDQEALSRWSHRIPNLKGADLWERLGDCIYDYSEQEPIQRPSVHGVVNIETDLSGKNVLISSDFYYLGREAIKLPNYLHPVCHQTQGHRSDANAPYFDRFVSWLRDLPLAPGRMHGWPDFAVDWAEVSSCGGCSIRKLDGENDPTC